ncbi:MAG: VOC family protein [Dichotomicrobium sp.]
MTSLTPYLFFDGNCREAMEFYKSCFGGELTVMRYADAPEGGGCPEADRDKVMHACLTGGDVGLMASDNPTGTPTPGDHVALSIHCDTMADIQRLFKALGAGGKVIMPLADQFWGAHFGMLIDKYGFHWMLNHPLGD